MARAAAQKGRKREKAHAGRRSGGGGSRNAQVVEQTLFFNRLRRQAKWMFVLLALVFGVGFVVFGVGGGIPGTSLGDIFTGSNGSGAPSESELRDQIKKNPNDAQAYQDLATQLQQDGKTQEAIDTLTTLSQVKPKDTTALTQLGSLYLLQANRFSNQAQRAQIEFAQVNPGAFIPSLATSTGQPVLTDPITQPAAQEASDRFNKAVSDAQGAYSSAVDSFRKVTKITPRDPQARLQLAQTAQNAGDAKTAISAYQAYLELAPSDPNAKFIRQQISQLKQQLKQQAAQSPAGG